MKPRFAFYHQTAIMIVDIVAIFVFAIVGRLSHGLEMGLVGVFETAWPFLVGAVLGWISVQGSRFELGAFGPGGLLMWVITVFIGISLRSIGLQSTSIPFMIVATVVLAVLLLVPRLVFGGFWGIAPRTSARRPADAAPGRHDDGSDPSSTRASK